jgi:Peptidase family C78
MKILAFFESGQDIFQAFLIFFHVAGHSRTIVGVEETAGGSPVLLLFDPGCWTMAQFLNAKPHEIDRKMNLLRRPSVRITDRQYQIVKVVGILQDHELEVNSSRCSILNWNYG